MHGSGRGRKRTKRSQLHFLRDFQAGKGWLAQAYLFARREQSDPRYVAVGAKAAQMRFKLIEKIERGLRSLGGIGPLFVGYAHLEVDDAYHWVVVERGVDVQRRTTQDLDELLELCDSLVVINLGSLSRLLKVGEVSIEEIGLLMGGVHGDPQATVENSVKSKA